MKNLVILNALDGSSRAINPDHIVQIRTDLDNILILRLSNGDIFETKMQFYNVVELINKSYE